MTINSITGKYYIGKHITNNVNDDYFGSGTALKRALKKYGKENFRKYVLMYCSSEEELNDMEKKIVDKTICDNNIFYNIKEGGLGSFYHINKKRKNIYGYNGRHPNSLKNLKKGIEKIKQLKKSKKDFKIFREKISRILKEKYRKGYLIPSFSGKKHSEETKKKISEKLSLIQKGKKNSQYGTCWITNGIIERKISKNEIIPEGWRRGRITSKFEKDKKIKDNTKKVKKSRKEIIKDFRKNLKKRMIEYKGGKCQKCGYSYCNEALSFHHLNSADKSFKLSSIIASPKKWDTIKEELDKCILLCHNCHSKIHYNETDFENYNNKIRNHRIKYWRDLCKKKIIEIMGGNCQCCGFRGTSNSLALHHINSQDKKINISSLKISEKNWPELKEELKKCILVCHNCHSEIHSGMRKMPKNFTKFNEKLYNFEYFEEYDKCPVCEKDKPVRRKYCSNSCASLNKGKIDWSIYNIESLVNKYTPEELEEMFDVEYSYFYKLLKKHKTSKGEKNGSERCEKTL